MKKKMVCILMAGVMASLVPAQMELNVEGLNENGTENLEYCVEQGKNNVGGYREMAYAELKETISNELTGPL